MFYIIVVTIIHYINLIVMKNIFLAKLSAFLFRYIYTIHLSHFLRKMMGCFANMIACCTGTVNRPVQPCIIGSVLQYTLCQRTPANITQTNHQYLHSANLINSVSCLSKNNVFCISPDFHLLSPVSILLPSVTNMKIYKISNLFMCF